jgi:hypothetical protein
MAFRGMHHVWSKQDLVVLVTVSVVVAMAYSQDNNG